MEGLHPVKGILYPMKNKKHKLYNNNQLFFTPKGSQYGDYILKNKKIHESKIKLNLKNKRYHI